MTEDLTRTHVALIILLVGAVLTLVVTTAAVLEPETFSGAGMGGGGGFSTLAIVISCVGLLAIIVHLAGLGTLLSDARNYGQEHYVACLVALVLFIVGIVVPIAGSVGGASFARTGDMDAYRRTLLFSALGTVLSALALSLAAWHLFKPDWRAFPALVAIARLVAGVGQILATRAHSTLAATTFGDQTVYLPRFDVPLDSGPLFNWQVAGWAGVVILGGMWAMLLFAGEDTMRQRPEKPKPAPVED